MTNYQRCTICVLDTTDADITFDSTGQCNHCSEWLPRIAVLPKTSEESKLNLSLIAEQIKASKANKRFNCIIGLSGGVDSSYIAYLANELELNPLDNTF